MSAVRCDRSAAYAVECWLQDAAVRGSIKQVQVKGQNTGWLSMNNIWGAAWEIEQSPQPPLDFRFVDDSGSEVTLKANPLCSITPDLQLHERSMLMRDVCSMTICFTYFAMHCQVTGTHIRDDSCAWKVKVLDVEAQQC